MRSYSNLSYLADMQMPNSTADWSSFTLATAEHPLAYPLAHLYFAILDADSSARGYPAGKQIQDVARALLSEPVQQQINDDHYVFNRIHLNSSVVQSFEADIANVVVQQIPPEDDRLSFCQVCGSEAYEQLLLDTAGLYSVLDYTLDYNFEGYRDAMHQFSIGDCNMMLLDDSLLLQDFLTRRRLPSAQINPMLDQSSPALVHRFTKYLSALSSNWSAVPDWAASPCVTLMQNNSKLYETQFALGISWPMQNESSAAKAVLIKNRAGAWVSGVTGNTSVPADVRLPSAFEGALWQNFTFASSGADDVYPMTSASFMVWDFDSTSAGYPAGEQLKNLSSGFLSKDIQEILPQYFLDPLGIGKSTKLLGYLRTIDITLAAKRTEFVPAGDPSKANMSIQAACCLASGQVCNGLALLENSEVSYGRPFQSHDNVDSEQEAVDRLLGSTNLDFVLSHIPATARAMAASMRRIVHIPFGYSPLVVMYTIPGIPAGALKLDAHALARLYSCKSLQLDNYIQGLNPTLRLPDINVTPIALSRSDPTSQMFIEYLAQDAAWDGEARSMENWATCVQVANGSQGSVFDQMLFMAYFSANIGYNNMGVYSECLDLSDFLASSNRTDGKDPVAQPASVNNSLLYNLRPAVASILNKEGVFMSPVTSNLSFPYNASSLPPAISSPDWAEVQLSKGTMVCVVWGKELSLITTELCRAMPCPSSEELNADICDTEVYGGIYGCFSWIPKKCFCASPTRYVTLAGMALIGLAVVGSRLYWRSSGSSMASSQMMLLADSDFGLENTQELLELMVDSHGNPVELGSGSFAKVYKGRWRGVLVAVKVLHHASKEHQEDLLKEAAILRRLRHPNVVKFLGLGTNGSDEVMMITEFMQGGDLRKALDQGSPSMCMGWYKKGRSIAMGLAQSLAYLHSQSARSLFPIHTDFKSAAGKLQVISFDVKPENILLDHTMTIARLTDVGLAKVLEGSHTNTMGRGTFDYMAPELFGSYEHEGDAPTSMSGEYRPKVTSAVDIYSFGCVLWEIVTGQRMQRSQTPLRDPRVPEECPQCIAELLTKCLSPDPKQRPSALAVVSTLAYA
ncbi:probable serine/threonine-protein kinase DDB_G0281745 at C-terminar half [Coccomyxa sp. Obi]|nr:probable serine/threonine-protein kinase DDB_G0281745 at C-terminar half [Coccomyxa sp. Obi]